MANNSDLLDTRWSWSKTFSAIDQRSGHLTLTSESQPNLNPHPNPNPAIDQRNGDLLWEIVTNTPWEKRQILAAAARNATNSSALLDPDTIPGLVNNQKDQTQQCKAQCHPKPLPDAVTATVTAATTITAIVFLLESVTVIISVPVPVSVTVIVVVTLIQFRTLPPHNSRNPITLQPHNPMTLSRA